jgi:histidyl-tRNA synthetase
MGIERVIASLKAQAVQPPPLPAPRVQVSPLGEQARVAGIKLARQLREAGIGALLAFGGRSLKSQLKSADKANVAYTLILGEQELAQDTVLAREMATSQQTSVNAAEIVNWLRGHLGLA